MLALLKTVLTVFVFLVQFSSGAVIKRNGSPPYYPWWPWHSWPPPAHHTYGVPTSTRASILSPLSTATRFSPFPTTTSSHDDDSFTSFFPVETEVASACPSSADGIAVTSSTAPTVTISPTRATSTKVPSTIQTTTVKPQSTQPTTLSPATTTSKAPSSSSASGDFWKPTAGVTWQIQIFGTVDTSIAADVYDVDLFDTPASTIATLHAAGRKVICYFSAGSYEDWRSDQSSFQASDKGSAMQGWQGEWWLNTNSANVRSIMAKRIEMAVSKGCDAVDPDNVDGYANANGIDIQEADAVDYLNFLASNAHSRGIAIGLKNAGGLINSVLPVMQFAVNEQCEQFNECSVSKPFIDAGKPVFHIEYPDGAPNISPEAKIASCSVPAASGFSTVLKTNDLSAWVDPC
ncbi:related to endo alpha-1,4 polygalactosaminidase precusor [Phialocephala subalpina]|uniref:alpha-galactosidase n=1 Tax=Phialocephala subalpina TaxID=576137 RepID=A0A1L7WYR1_9HELO|nr:related to endo alpha-1,4 polygalactosaminidase precusor [Phialocephala subalpina]